MRSPSRTGCRYGDVWTWTAICADTKLVPSWLVGLRDTEDATAFIADLAGRLSSRVQLTTDGHRPYLAAVESAFGSDIDYAVLHKIYGSPTGAGDERRYSPAVCTGIDKRSITGNPDRAAVSTSYDDPHEGPQRLPHHARDGRWRHRPRVDTHRDHRTAQLKLTHDLATPTYRPSS